jgi:hypothetical protein
MISGHISNRHTFGYTPLGKDLGHIGSSPMTNKKNNGNLAHEALNDEAIIAIVIKLRKHTTIHHLSSQLLLSKISRAHSIACRKRQYRRTPGKEYTTTRYVQKDHRIVLWTLYQQYTRS